jgi:hippurate hydrolase
MSQTEMLDQARDLAEPIVALRRAIHAEPELGLANPKTRDKVRAALSHLPLEWREGPSTTGLVARLVGTGNGEGRRVLLRGDTDALPMDEETGLPFASQVPGAMHSCGHDTHVAMLAGAAHLLCARADRLAGEVLFMFQPGEEGWHGARYMIDDGLLDPLPQAAFALHVMPDRPYGVIAGRAGPLLASADRFEITIEGRGGHASLPHQTLDPMPIACEVVGAIQTMVTRRFSVGDPVVVTVSEIHAGTAHNVIPDRVRMRGTMRTLSRANRVALHAQLPALAKGIAAAHGLSAHVAIAEGFPVTVCDARAVDLGEAVAAELGSPARFDRMSHPIMGAEDFAYVLDKVPGAMFFLGVAAPDADLTQCRGIHSPRMMVDETALPIGTALLAGCAERFLARGFA